MIHSLTIVPATGCLSKMLACDGIPSPLPLIFNAPADAEKRQAWRKSSVKTANQSCTVVPRESGESICGRPLTCKSWCNACGRDRLRSYVRSQGRSTAPDPGQDGFRDVSSKQ